MGSTEGAKESDTTQEQESPQESESPAAERIEHAIMVRESDIADMIMMQNMIAKTLASARGIPGVSEAVALGLDPLLHPERYGADERRTTHHRMVLFNLQGTLFLYAMGTAAKEDPLTRMNDYATFMQETIVAFRPRHLYIAGISRLLRSTSLVSTFQTALKEHGCILHADGSIMNLREQSGELIFTMMASFAAFERDQIVMRTTAGRVAAAEAGRPLFQVSDLPLGYRQLPNGCVGPDPQLKPQVEAMLRILAMDDLNSRQKARAISAAGIRLPRNYGLVGSDDMADSRDPKSVIRGMRKWLPLYETGVHTQYLDNPFPGATRIGTATVLRNNPDEAGTIEVNNRWGLPEGGWADSKVLAAARRSVDAYAARRAELIANGGQGHSRRKPLLGLVRWVDDEAREWFLDSHNLTDYRLRRRPRPQDGTRSGWAEVTIDGDLIARVPAAALHASIAAGVTEGLSTGVAAAELQSTFIASAARRLLSQIRPENVAAGLRIQLAEHHRRAARCRKMAATLEEVEDAQPWIDDAVAAGRKAREVQAQLDDIVTEKPEPRATLIDPMMVDIGMCAHAMATLKRISTDADGQVNDMLRHLIKDLRIVPSGNGYVQWSLKLAMPKKDGAVLLGPFVGRVKTQTRFRPTTSSSLTTTPRREQALDILASGANLPAVVEAIPAWSPLTAQTQMSKFLLGKGLPRAAFASLLSCPISEVRHVVFATLRQHANPDVTDLDMLAAAVNPPGHDVAWTRLVLRSYLFSDAPPPARMWAAKSADSQRILDHIATAGGQMALWELGEALDGQWSRSEILRLVMRDRINGNRRQLLYTHRGTPWAVNKRGRVSPGSKLGLIACPHCGGWAARICRVEEVPRQLLCPTCRRMPVPNSPVFPESYLLLPSSAGSRSRDWDIFAPSIARQQRDANLSAEDRAALERPCVRCKVAYIPARGNQKYCPPCGKAMLYREPMTPDD